MGADTFARPQWQPTSTGLDRGLSSMMAPQMAQPLGVDPGLWAASGQGGLSTAQGGYSQDPTFWENMNRIATGTQQFTPWTQEPLAPGVRGKPLRSGFSGIPVPFENTVGYTTYNSDQPESSPRFGSPLPDLLRGPLAGVGRFGRGGF